MINVHTAQLGQECTIFESVTAIMVCHLHVMYTNLALLAYINTLGVQAKHIDKQISCSCDNYKRLPPTRSHEPEELQ